MYRGATEPQHPTFYISDPTDRSAQLHEFLLGQGDQRKMVGEVLATPDARTKWEEKFGSPASITGACSAVTCVRFGIPIAAAIVNFVTQELFVASRMGCIRLDIPDLEPSDITLAEIKKRAKPIYFPAFTRRGEVSHSFITFLGKTDYTENLLELFKDTKFFHDKENDPKKYCKYTLPGGPTRILYLSDIQPTEPYIGFILANGEKLGEWVHWIPFIRFGRAPDDVAGDAPLLMHEIHQARPRTKDGILMATTPLYSIFVPADDKSDNMIIDVNKLRTVPNPSRFRSTLFVANRANAWANALMDAQKFRQISFPLPRGRR